MSPCAYREKARAGETPDEPGVPEVPEASDLKNEEESIGKLLKRRFREYIMNMKFFKDQ
ncbi:MAG: hypothetical protein GY950_20435 [bacterium]|nr:hypothetical protein [bacterium]